MGIKSFSARQSKVNIKSYHPWGHPTAAICLLCQIKTKHDQNGTCGGISYDVNDDDDDDGKDDDNDERDDVDDYAGECVSCYPITLMYQIVCECLFHLRFKAMPVTFRFTCCISVLNLPS